MTSPEVSEERLEALLAGAAPATPAEEELVAFMTELRGEPVGAPAGLRARVRALEATPTPLERLRAALSGPGLRRSILVAAPACSLALAVGVVIGLGQRPSPAPPAPETTMLSTSTESGRAATPPARNADRPQKTGEDAGASTPAPANTPATPMYAPAPDVSGPSHGSIAPIAPAPAESVTAQGSGARVLPGAAPADEREAARAEAVADALADAASKAQRAADRAGVELGPPEAVAVDSPQAPACAPAPAPAGATPPVAPTPPAPPAPEGGAAAAPAPTATCTVAADVSVTYPTQTDGTSASPPSP